MHTLVMSLPRRREFERAVLRAVAAGAIAGLLRAGLIACGVSVALWLPTAIAVGIFGARGDRLDRILIRVLAVLCAGLGAALPLDAAELCGGALAGALLVWSARCERGTTQIVDSQQIGPVNYAIGAGLGAGLCWMGTAVASALAARGLAIGVPEALAGAFGGSVVGLFLGLSSVAGHAVLQHNPVEALAAEVLPGLRGDWEALARRAVNGYRDCARALMALPSRPEREELALTLSELTREALGISEQWAGVEDDLSARDAEARDRTSRDLDAAASRAVDPVAQAHFALAASALQEEGEVVRELQRRRERMVAKLWSQVALIERTRTSLVGARSGQVQIRAAELSTLARKLAALGRTEGLDGRLASEVATAAELKALDA